MAMRRKQDFKSRRADLGLTQFEIAIKCDLSLPTVQRFESGKATTLSPLTIRRLADGYGVKVSDIEAVISDAHPAPTGPVTDTRTTSISTVT